MSRLQEAEVQDLRDELERLRREPRRAACDEHVTLARLSVMIMSRLQEAEVQDLRDELERLRREPRRAACDEHVTLARLS
eukprot:1176778-Prorocentrum_minimum.AAC.1